MLIDHAIIALSWLGRKGYNHNCYNRNMQQQFQKFVVKGQKPLHGKIKISGSKNAALPILCAALLGDESSIIENVPDIADIHTLLKIFDELNVKTTFKKGVVTVDPSRIRQAKLSDEHICSMRGSVVLLGPLLTRFKEIEMPLPGGCVLGKRSFAPHTHAFRALGAEIVEELEKLHLRVKKFHPAQITMPESSVTATENLLMAAALIPSKTEIRLAAMEPHVQDLCHFLTSMGAKISGIGTHYLSIEGVQKLKGTRYRITGDYLQAGTFAIASLITQGQVTIEGINTSELDSFWQKLTEANARFELRKNAVTLFPSKKLQAIAMLRTAVYPSFATDLQAPFAVLLTQAHGESKIFETLFEGRLNYIFELEKMGAKVEILNPHQAVIKGPTVLKGVPITSCDIRAGAAMVLAALCAKGTTEISNISYIDRGYEALDQRLQGLGAEIKRISD